MAQLPFYIVDVFAETKYSGNQLAVFLNAGGLTTAEMQRIAREINYSETTFVLADQAESDGYSVRIFTPAEELPFAGHPVLGTAEVIRRVLLKEPVLGIKLNLNAGPILVEFSRSETGPEILWMHQNPPAFGPLEDDRRGVARVLGLAESDLDPCFPVQEVSTGLPFMIVPVRSLQLVRKAKTDQQLLRKWTRERQAKAIIIFTPETYDPAHHLNARVFVDVYGIPEDPATGSANGCLAGYLVEHCFFGTDQINLQVEQGYEIGRPALLYLQAQSVADRIAVRVGGRVQWVAQGEWDY